MPGQDSVGGQQLPPHSKDEYLEFFALLMAVAETHELNLTRYELSGSDEQIKKIIIQTFVDAGKTAQTALTKREATERIDQMKERYKIYVSRAFCYEFSDDDTKTMQRNINAMRDLISQSEQIEENHKHRLLKRLERLQQELHKKISDLDRFWGLIGDASVVLKKVGENATPIVEHVKAIMEIVWRAQTRASGLPEGAEIPLLDSKNE